MNSSAVTTAGHWNITVLAAPCSQDLKIPRCPLVLMFDLIRSTARLFLIGSAGAVLGLAGFILSILAYIKEALGGKQPRKLSADVLAAPELTSPPRDRDRRTRMPRKPQTRHDRTKRSSDRPKSPRARFSGSGSTVTSSSPSRDLEGPEQERPGRPRRRRTQGSTRDMSSVDDVVVTIPRRPAPTIVTSEVTTESSPPWRPQRSLSDISSAQSSEISTRRLSLEGHLPISGRRVLMKIKDSHSQLRERCLTRVQSLPPNKASARPPRTDPYQAPYFFPSPMSPEAATYIQEIVNERQGTFTQPTTSPVDIESSTTDAISVPSPPRAKRELGPMTRRTRAPSPSPSLPADKSDVSPPTKRHRWSLHLPHLPHHHAHDGVRLVDGQIHEKGGSTAHKELFSRLKFGHHRRRHGVGSADSHVTVSSVAS